MASYQELLKQRDYLGDLSRSGVIAARNRIDAINSEIDKYRKNPFIFDPRFVHAKEGFNYKLLQSLIYQAGRGSKVCEIEVQKYADWVIVKMAMNR